jgi:hypothetical protein
MDELAKHLNKTFNTNRTPRSISCKLSDLTKRDDVKIIKKISTSDKIIIKHIKLNPTNIRYAIELASEELSVSFQKLNNRYYKHLKHSKTILTVGSEIGFSNNVKNNIRDINGNLPTPDMNDVQWLMKQILDLPESDRNKIKILLQ